MGFSGRLTRSPAPTTGRTMSPRSAPLRRRSVHEPRAGLRLSAAPGHIASAGGKRCRGTHYGSGHPTAMAMRTSGEDFAQRSDGRARFQGVWLGTASSVAASARLARMDRAAAVAPPVILRSAATKNLADWRGGAGCFASLSMTAAGAAVFGCGRRRPWDIGTRPGPFCSPGKSLD